MWPFKKKPKHLELRICYQYGKYRIERFYKPLETWEILHYYKYINKHEWLEILEPTYAVQFDTLTEARKKASEIEPQYFCYPAN